MAWAELLRAAADIAPPSRHGIVSEEVSSETKWVTGSELSRLKARDEVTRVAVDNRVKSSPAVKSQG